MKQMIAVSAIAFAIVSCKDKDKDKDTPAVTPSPTAGSGSGSVAPTPPTAPENVDKACVAKIAIEVGSIDWSDNVGGTGSLDIDGDKPGSVDTNVDVTKLKEAIGALAAKGCSAEIGAADVISYQRLILVMDTVLAGGIKDVSVSSGDGAAVKPPVASGGGDLQSAAVVVITKTEVTLDGKPVAPATATDLQAKLGTILTEYKKAKPGGAAILQADVATAFGTIRDVLRAAKDAGYDDVLFAVKNK